MVTSTASLKRASNKAYDHDPVIPAEAGMTAYREPEETTECVKAPPP
jgi:hypothetical protein